MIGGIQRSLRWLLRPLHRFWIVRTTVPDPWEPATTFLIGPGRFGTGSRQPFSWYFEGQSTVVAADVASICDWLCTCQYIHDSELFREPDYWQHPLTFEQLRKGDCEDHALWAWRKMVELEIPADFYVGQWRREVGDIGFHAWVVFERDGSKFLLEPVIKEAKRMVKLLDEARNDYVPHYSVDAKLKMCARAGLLVHWREEELARRAGKRGQAGV